MLARARSRSMRLRDAQVQLGAAQTRHPVVERAAHELVGELIGQPARGDLLDHAVRDALARERGARPARPITARSNSWPATAASSSTSIVAGVESRQALAHDLADALGAGELGEQRRRAARRPTARAGVDAASATARS